MKDSILGVMLSETPMQILRARREMQGLSQEVAAQKIGVPLEQYQAWERGEMDGLQDMGMMVRVKSGLKFDTPALGKEFARVMGYVPSQVVSTSTLNTPPSDRKSAVDRLLKMREANDGTVQRLK